MKKLILINVFLLLSLFSYSQEKLYKEMGKTQLLSADEYDMYKRVKTTKLQKVDGGIKLIETLIDSTSTETSIVYTYKVEIVFSSGVKICLNSKKAKVYSLCGQKFPDFELKSLGGETIKLSDFKGKPILLNFWFNGCKSCIAEMPRLNEIKEKYKDKLVFLSVTYNNKKEVDLFLKSHKFEFLHLIDAKSFTEQVGIEGYPKTILVNKEGSVHQVLDAIYPKLDDNNNVVPGEGQELIREIEKII